MDFDALTKGPDSLVRADDDDDDHEHGTGMAAPTPVVDSGAKDRLNPPVEYEVLDLAGGADLKAKLNELGQDGWVLVATTPSFIFRRIKKTEEEKKKSRVGFAFGKG